ncbi:MAG: TrbI/VirB10 family protein [Gammaproteobacteria bacterium]|nr:TrbI/VirB10 family protein [Gammaproteobacteria bacterium]
MFKKSKLEIHPKPKQPIQINRPLIITTSIAVATALSLSIIAAFTTTKTNKSNSPSAISKTNTNSPSIISPELSGLPGSYSDVDIIKKYSADLGNPQLASLLQKFNDLQNEYIILRQQLASQKTPTPEKRLDDPALQRAKTSDLVFNGLGSGVDNLVGGSQSGSRQFQPNNQNANDLVATPQQEELFKEQERNKQKLAVMKGKDNPADIYDMHNMATPISPFQIQAGTIMPATLITGINTSASGTVVAQITQNIYDTVSGKYLLIPKGSKLLGKYDSGMGSRVSYGQTRALVVINRLIRPDGSSLLLGNFNSADLGGYAGTEGNVNNHWASVIGAATITGVLSFAGGMGADRERSHGDQYPSAKESGFRSATQGITDVGKSLAARSMNIPPTITIRPGHQFNVVVNKDMVLTRYNPKTY